MPFDRNMSNDVYVGARVFTVDGEEIGRVGEVQAHAFKVDVAMQPDYWLGTDCVRVASPGEVRLAFAKRQLDDFKREGPAPT